MAEEKQELLNILVRLERVEKQNRNLKRGGLLAMLLVSMLFIMGQAKSDRTLEADTLKAGRIVAGDIYLSDEDGNTTNLVPGSMIVATKFGPFVLINASKEGPSVRLELSPNSRPSFSVISCKSGALRQVLLSQSVYL